MFDFGLKTRYFLQKNRVLNGFSKKVSRGRIVLPMETGHFVILVPFLEVS